MRGIVLTTADNASTRVAWKPPVKYKQVNMRDGGRVRVRVRGRGRGRVRVRVRIRVRIRVRVRVRVRASKAWQGKATQRRQHNVCEGRNVPLVQ
jgi:hypothetical protein